MTSSLDPYEGQANLPAITHNSAPKHANVIGQGIYLGIPKPLISELIEIYFENVCNSSLLLHKQRFLETVKTGTAVPHTLLSVCAGGAKYIFQTIATGSATDSFLTAFTKTVMGLQHSRRAVS